jgi:hypothetical protein
MNGYWSYMWLIDRLPLSDKPDVRERADELFDRRMLGSVFIGKYIGDYAAHLTTALLGVHLGHILGIVATLALFIYWDRLNNRAKQASNELRPAQTTMNDWPEE